MNAKCECIAREVPGQPLEEWLDGWSVAAVGSVMAAVVVWAESDAYRYHFAGSAAHYDTHGGCDDRQCQCYASNGRPKQRDTIINFMLATPAFSTPPKKKTLELGTLGVLKEVGATTSRATR